MSNALEVGTMLQNQFEATREARRFIKKLKPKELELINKFSMDRAKDIANEMLFSDLANFRIATLAAMYLKLGDSINTNDMQEMLVLANMLSYETDYLKLFGRDWTRKMDKLKLLMKKEMKKMWEKESIHQQNRMLREIKKDSRFIKIANKDIIVVFKELKDEMAGIEIDTIEESKNTVEKAMNYIFEEEADEIKPVEKSNEKIRTVVIPQKPAQKVQKSINESEVKEMKTSEKLESQFEEMEYEYNDLDAKIFELENKKELIKGKKEKLEQAINLLKSIEL